MAEAQQEGSEVPDALTVGPGGVSGPVGEGGGVLSPLSGSYLLIVLSEPMSESHKLKMIQKLKQGTVKATYLFLPAFTRELASRNSC